MKFWRRLTLRVKFLFALTVLTVGMLGAFTFMAVRDFARDKTRTIFSDNLSSAMTVASQISAETRAHLETLGSIAVGYDLASSDFVESARLRFESVRSHLSVTVLASGPGGSGYRRVAGLHKSGAAPAAVLDEFVRDVLAESVAIVDDAHPGRWRLGMRATQRGSAQPLVFIAEIDGGSFLDVIGWTGARKTAVVTSKGRILRFDPAAGPGDRIPWDLIAARILGGAENSQTFELAADGGDAWLVAAAPVNFGGLRVITVTPKAVAMEPVRVLLIKSLMLLTLLVGLTFVVSVFLAGGLTAGLKSLMQATSRVAGGQFDVALPVRSEDEMGQLAGSFNVMTQEIRRLMSETAEKARMESELVTAQAVQAMLFPREHFAAEGFELRGYYEPASECGGDWWYYSRVDGKIFLFIGDATGHGAPAALVTSAAKSAAYVAQGIPGAGVKEILRLMNKAIYENTRGKILMTFCLACYDPATGRLTYGLASHELPFLFPKSDQPLNRKLVRPLIGQAGYRLGDQPDSEYEVEEIQLQPGDRVMFYTDGVTELKNAAGEMLGERQMIQTVVKSINAGRDLESLVNDMNQRLSDFRAGCPLADDVTYFIFERKAA